MADLNREVLEWAKDPYNHKRVATLEAENQKLRQALAEARQEQASCTCGTG